MSLRANTDETLIAVASFDGYLKILDKTKRQALFCWSDQNNFQIPLTNARWKPTTKLQLILTSYLNGEFFLIDTSKQKNVLNLKENYQIYGLDYTSDGNAFIFCGNDSFVMDSENAKLIANFSSPSIKDKHSHHIYGVRTDHNNPHLFFSGGWDEIIYLWDTRKQSYANYLTGPLISTDSMDVIEFKLVTGSWRNHHQLEVWDLRKFRKVQELDWNSGQDSLVQVCKFQRNNASVILSAGTHEAGAQLFKEDGVWQKIDTFNGGDSSYYSGDFMDGEKGNEIYLGNEKGELSIINILL